MSEAKQKKLSVITITIIFLLIVLLTIVVAQKVGISDTLAYTDNLSLSTTNNVHDTTSAKINNQALIKTIKKEYGINILYGQDTKNVVKKIDANSQDDEYVINNNIKNIYECLKKYPPEILDIFKTKQFTLYIVIVDKFTNNNLALASKNGLNEVRIYISNTNKFKRAFHHEMFHILEYYMMQKDKNVFYEWSKLNPTGFKYNMDINNLDSNYVYIKTEEKKLKNNDQYFITKYSKTSEKEDRAEIFAEFMEMKSIPECFSKTANIRKKLDYILEELRLNISNVIFVYSKYLN